MSGLVREGSNGPALMQVTLMNEGDDAYKPEVYGNRIVIERRIAKGSGTGGYSLLSTLNVPPGAKPKLISREKKDLEDILRTFNIYIDNPCCVLTQEDSKKFIHGGEHDKYEFFLKVSQLTQFHQSHSFISCLSLSYLSGNWFETHCRGAV